jgi:hypothetical protein
LFSTDFCHPVKVDKDTPETMWSLCVSKTTTIDCSVTTGCNWSNGKELIPDSDFCAPQDLTNDVDLIKRCVSSDLKTTCGAGCAWRHGTNPVPQPPAGVDPLFASDFCHPVVVNKDTKDSVW